MENVLHIANWFIRRAQKDHLDLTPKKLMNLVYIAYGWHFEICHEKLFDSRIEAWISGVSIPDIFNHIKRQGAYVTREIPAAGNVGPDKQVFLEKVWSIYGHLTSKHLNEIVCVDKGPWYNTYQIKGPYGVIVDETIYDYYVDLREQCSQTIVSFD